MSLSTRSRRYSCSNAAIYCTQVCSFFVRLSLPAERRQHSLLETNLRLKATLGLTLQTTLLHSKQRRLVICEEGDWQNPRPHLDEVRPVHGDGVRGQILLEHAHALRRDAF
eukprot:8462191-Pyramimonas_sp.AAC.6